MHVIFDLLNFDTFKYESNLLTTLFGWGGGGEGECALLGVGWFQEVERLLYCVFSRGFCKDCSHSDTTATFIFNHQLLD